MYVMSECKCCLMMDCWWWWWENRKRAKIITHKPLPIAYPAKVLHQYGEPATVSSLLEQTDFFQGGEGLSIACGIMVFRVGLVLLSLALWYHSTADGLGSKGSLKAAINGNVGSNSHSSADTFFANRPPQSVGMPNGTGNVVMFAPFLLVATAEIPETFLSFNFDWNLNATPGDAWTNASYGWTLDLQDPRLQSLAQGKVSSSFVFIILVTYCRGSSNVIPTNMHSFGVHFICIHRPMPSSHMLNLHLTIVLHATSTHRCP